jgi:integrase
MPLNQIAVEIGFDGYLDALDNARRGWPKPSMDYEAKLEQVAIARKRYVREILDGDRSRWELVADNAITKRDLSLTKGSSEYTLFVDMIADATVDALNVFERRSGGDLEAQPKSSIVAKAKDIAKAGENLMEVFERWGAERFSKGEKRLDTVNQDRKIIEQFALFVGAERAISSISGSDVYEYRETLRDLPPKWATHRSLRGLDMRASAIRSRELMLPRLAYTTINKHLSTISPLFKWLAGKPQWMGLKNPCDGLFHDGVKGKNRRPSLTTPVLNNILSSPLFTGFLSDGAEHLPGQQQADDWRKWIPLVCMFTGARIGEIAQLRIGDVRREHGVWFVHIAHDEKVGQSTKSGVSRAAAVHSQLQKIGFLDFVARQQRGGDYDLQPLFPELRPNGRDQIGAQPSRWWRDYLRAIGVKQGRDGFGAHSFRHELADRLREEAELLDNEVAVCLGHSSKTTTGGYGRIRQGTVNMLSNWMEAVRWEGVEFSYLYSQSA